MDGPEEARGSYGGNVKVQQHGGVTWVDVQNPGSAVFDRLEQEYKLHELHLSESIQKVQHTQVEREENYLFLVLHFPVFKPHTGKVFASQVGVFLGKNYLITIHADETPFVSDLYAECQRGAEQAAEYFGQGSAYLLYVFISRLLGSIASMTDIVESELDGIEGSVFENNTSDAQRIGRLRQKIVRLRRLVGPKKTLLEDLAEQINSFAGQGMSKYYFNNVKTVARLWEALDEAKETIEVYKDADFTTSTERTNRILAILTLIFTFTIPITVLGTLYGMNVFLPGGLESGSWMLLGRYTTFTFIVVISAAAAIAMYLYFRRKKWF